MAENKVMYGLKNVHYAKITQSTDPDTGAITESYGAVKAWPGGVNIALDPSGSPIIFAADNTAYYTVANNQGYEGDFESARIPDDIRIDLLGNKKDSKNMIIETDKDQISQFALMFEIDGDQRPNRYIFYKVSLAERPGVSSSTTDPSSDLEVGTETVQFKAVPSTKVVTIDGVECALIKAFTSADTDATAYANFYSTVYEPTFTASKEGDDKGGEG